MWLYVWKAYVILKLIVNKHTHPVSRLVGIEKFGTKFSKIAYILKQKREHFICWLYESKISLICLSTWLVIACENLKTADLMVLP